MRTKKPKTQEAAFYWRKTGKHSKLADKLHKKIPAFGEVNDPDSNPKLETFRVANNAYYDLYNNGLCNRSEEFEDIFGFLPAKKMILDDEGSEVHANYNDFQTDRLTRLEAAMDKIILAAAKEQRIHP